MRLYHFTNQKYGLRAIKDRRLKIARINELNDPFEFLGWNIQNRATRARMQKWKLERNNEIGILCFSSKWTNPLLWGHYADKHRGVAIGFDVPDIDMLKPVRYCRKRLTPPADFNLASAEVDSLLIAKFSAWRYESEYRYFSVLNNCICIDGLYFNSFSPHFKLAQVIVGANSTVTRAELAAALGDQKTHVTTFKARPAFGTFSVVRNRDDALWQ